MLAEGRDNVVSIPATDALKMLALSVVWGSWIVVRNAASRAISPLWSISLLGDADDGLTATTDSEQDKSEAAGTGDKTDRMQLAPHARRDRPPPCLFTTVYGTHSYVKVKVTYLYIRNAINYVLYTVTRFRSG